MAIYKINNLTLKKEYLGNKKSIVKISKDLNIPSHIIYKYLKEFNIKRRSYSESQLGKKHSLITKKNMSLSRKGKKQSEEHIKNRFLSRKGYKHSDKTKRKIGLKNKEISYWKDKKRPEHSKQISGRNHPNWIDGRSYEKYPSEFTEKLRNEIRKRDNYECKNCNMTQEEHFIVYGRNIEIHHIDYNRNNCDKWNLITLCKQCNLRANKNRDYWKAFYNQIRGKVYDIQNK